MKPTASDLIYNAVYKECLKINCGERISKDAAVEAVRKYKNGQFTKSTKLIDEAVAGAKKIMKPGRK